jgi:hypothetical protein
MAGEASATFPETGATGRGTDPGSRALRRSRRQTPAPDRSPEQGRRGVCQRPSGPSFRPAYRQCRAALHPRPEAPLSPRLHLPEGQPPQPPARPRAKAEAGSERWRQGRKPWATLCISAVCSHGRFRRSGRLASQARAAARIRENPGTDIPLCASLSRSLGQNRSSLGPACLPVDKYFPSFTARYCKECYYSLTGLAGPTCPAFFPHQHCLVETPGMKPEIPFCTGPTSSSFLIFNLLYRRQRQTVSWGKRR